MKNVIILLVVFFALSALKKHLSRRSIAKKAEKDAGASRAQGGEALVHDGVCDSYIPESAALSVIDNGRKVYFCSPECKQRYGRGA